MINYGSLRSRGVAWLNMPPCQGGERGFKSRRDRSKAILGWLFFILQTILKQKMLYLIKNIKEE